MLKSLGTVSRGVILKKCSVNTNSPSAVVLARKYAQSTRSPQSAARPALQEVDTMSQTNGFIAHPPETLLKPINVPNKLLMGPGPTNCSPRVLQACSLHLGHMHPETFKVMDEIKEGMQYLFQTQNPWTLVVSGPGHLGMEAILVNLLQPGETALIGVSGLWGKRAADLVGRIGANPVALESELGESISLQQIEEGLRKHKPKVLFLVHSESSTGVMQSLEGVGDLCREHDCLLAVDTVASLGGVPFYMDAWKVDAVYTGSQKVIGAPPGLAPMSFGPRAVEKIKTRPTPIKSYLLDMNQLTIQWQCNDPSIPRIYHHTPPTNILYGLREALAEIAEEGLEHLWQRHANASQRLHAGLKSLGLELFVQNPAQRLPTVTTFKIPEGVKDWKLVTQYANDKHLVEIAGGLGPTVGKVYRIGCLGYNAQPEKVDRVLKVLKESIEAAKMQGRL